MDGQTDRQPASQPVTVLLMVILDDRMASGFSSFTCLCLLISPQQSQRLFSKDELEVLCKIHYVCVISKNKLLSAGSAFASDLEKISLKLFLFYLVPALDFSSVTTQHSIWFVLLSPFLPLQSVFWCYFRHESNPPFSSLTQLPGSCFSPSLPSEQMMLLLVSPGEI